MFIIMSKRSLGKKQNKQKNSWAWWHPPLNPALRRQRQSDLCEVQGQPGLHSGSQANWGYRETLSQKDLPQKIMNQKSIDQGLERWLSS